MLAVKMNRETGKTVHCMSRQQNSDWKKSW